MQRQSEEATGFIPSEYRDVIFTLKKAQEAKLFKVTTTEEWEKNSDACNAVYLRVLGLLRFQFRKPGQISNPVLMRLDHTIVNIFRLHTNVSSTK